MKCKDRFAKIKTEAIRGGKICCSHTPYGVKEMQELRCLPNNLCFCYKNYSVFYVIIFQKIRKQEAKKMKYNLPERVIKDISKFAKKYSIEKVILFGSRARGTNTERSDIDIAVYGGDFDPFYWDIKEKVHSLLMFGKRFILGWIFNPHKSCHNNC